MVSEQEIQRALRASRVVPLDVANPHGPLGLEHLAAAVARITESEREELAIPLRRETREKLDQLARAEGEASARRITAAEFAAAIVEQYVSSMPSS